MNKLNETSEEMLERLCNDAGPKMQTSLRNLKAACDEIELARGSMSYSRVAEVATLRFNGPKKQSVQNNPLLKSYIAARNAEYEAKFNPRPRSNEMVGERAPSNGGFSPDLDIKTRLRFKYMQDALRRLELENKNISKALKEATRAAPLSIADLMVVGPDPEGGLQLKVSKVIPDSLRKLLTVLLGLDQEFGDIEQLAIRRVGEAGELICTDHGIERHILVQRQWFEIANWLRENKD